MAQLLSLLLAGEASNLKRRLRAGLIAWGIVAFMAFLALLFLLLALYIAAALHWGAVEAAAGFAIFFTVVAVITLVAYRMSERRYRRELERRRMENASLAATASAMTTIPALLGGRKAGAGMGAAVLVLAAVAGYAAYRQFEQRSRNDG